MLADLISRKTLEELAGSTVFRRGEAYFSAGAVSRARATEDKITAKVEGTDTYRVELWDDDGELEHDCTCPHSADGFFCKHSVALGLTWLEAHAPSVKAHAKPGKAAHSDPSKDIKGFLDAQPKDALIELLLEVAERDDRLYQSLLLKAQTSRVTGGGNVAKAFRHAIDEATRIRGFIDWREIRTFAGHIEEVADSLAELLKPATAATLVELAEYAIERVEGALEQVDDSNGEISEIVYRLGALHHKACTMAKPDAVALAERLFRFETTLPFGLCSFHAATYRDALGEKGLQRYRDLAEAQWRKIKPRTGDKGDDSHRAAITRVMERLAEMDGKVEDLIAIKSRDLSFPFSYLNIAEILVKAGQPDKALEWAERGLKAFPKNPGDQLRDFLVAAYLKRKRNDEALHLTWIQFEERHSLETYKKLHHVAGRLGIWPAQRERALTQIAESITRAAAATSKWKYKPAVPDWSLRVSIALWEKDIDAAWTAAHQGICGKDLLIELAGKLEASRPENAISLYRRVIPPIIGQTNNAAYEEAAKLIRKVGALMKTLDQPRQFNDYMAELHAQFKPKRNFIRLLDGVGRSSAGGKLAR